MKTITIRLPDVEAAMLTEVQKVNRAYRDLQGLLINQIQQEYQKCLDAGQKALDAAPNSPQAGEIRSLMREAQSELDRRKQEDHPKAESPKATAAG